MRTPMFIEVPFGEQSSVNQICRRVQGRLFNARIAPLPFAGNVEEIATVLENLSPVKPSIYVVNTLWAEDLLQDIDDLAKTTPVLAFQRQMLMFGGGNKLAKPSVEMLPHRPSRPVVVCQYTPLSIDELEQRVARALLRFLNTGDFGVIEQLTGMGLGSGFLSATKAV